ncbi:hypothetical protein O3P69_015643 [Scylla paramamosain]|uniref:Uncharacterized protein n=1 Tax=Scylla paramamosain TaxID=85552 RepID=A0AAW0SBY6_SCYPA
MSRQGACTRGRSWTGRRAAPDWRRTGRRLLPDRLSATGQASRGLQVNTGTLQPSSRLQGTPHAPDLRQWSVLLTLPSVTAPLTYVTLSAAARLLNSAKAQLQDGGQGSRLAWRGARAAATTTTTTITANTPTITTATTTGDTPITSTSTTTTIHSSAPSRAACVTSRHVPTPPCPLPHRRHRTAAALHRPAPPRPSLTAAPVTTTRHSRVTHRVVLHVGTRVTQHQRFTHRRTVHTQFYGAARKLPRRQSSSLLTLISTHLLNSQAAGFDTSDNEDVRKKWSAMDSNYGFTAANNCKFCDGASTGPPRSQSPLHTRGGGSRALRVRAGTAHSKTSPALHSAPPPPQNHGNKLAKTCRLTPSQEGCVCVAIMEDYFTKRTEAQPLKDKTATSVAVFICETVCRHDVPAVQITEQGRQL